MSDDDRITGQYDAVEIPRISKTAPSPVDPTRPAARLVSLDGTHPGRQWSLGRRATIGRGGRSDVNIEDVLVSREHAVISLDDAGWLVRDLGSRNGTFVNGRRVDVERLRYGDRVSIGHTILLLAHVDPMHERLVERQKVEALGRLGAGIAHDLNNYFGAILGALEFLDAIGEQRSLDDPEVRDCLGDVRAATARGAELTQRLLAFARRGGEENSAIELPRLIEEVVEIARRTFDRSVTITVSVAPHLTVRGDRGRLHQVLMNLLVNARDAMPKGGVVKIRAHALPPRADEASRIRIEVEDSGVGMDDATRERIFEPFFTTKAPDKGTGLGLAIVLDVVTAHGGTIACRSEVGRGTTFELILPAAESIGSRRETRTPHAIAARDPSRGGSVLVVDDEPMVRRTVRRLLERGGLRVVEASDGRRAVELVREGSEAIDVVLMDLDMPELDGEGACRELRQVAPQLPVVILSGLCDEVRRRRLEEAGVSAVLQKPCDATTLRRAIDAALSRSRPISPHPGEPPPSR